jgi:hypothetical protein
LTPQRFSGLRLSCESIGFIDDEGRLFGAVNVIDALVVLLLLAVLLASLALVNLFGGNQAETRYATVALGEQPEFVAEQISAGDQVPVENAASNLSVTDVYVGPGPTGNATVYARVELKGVLIESEQFGGQVFEFADEPVRWGRSLSLDTADYSVSGSVIDVATEGAELQTAQTAVVVQTGTTDDTADVVSVGDEYRLADQRIATVETLDIGPTGNPNNRRLRIGLTLKTIQIGDTVRFGSRPVRVGTTVPLAGGDYSLGTRVVQTGSSQLRGDRVTTEAVVKLANVQPEIADSIREGMTEGSGGSVTAEITEKRTEPAVVILTSEDGDIFQREHPRNEDVYLTVDLRTRETPTGLRFHGNRLQTGTTVVLDLGSVTVTGQVTELNDS